MEEKLSEKSPEEVMQSFADQIKSLSGNVSYGIITQSFNDEIGEVTIALHIVTPKLKNYSYRLVQATTTNMVNRFPISTVYYAKDSKNNLYDNCGNIDEFVNILEKYIKYPITKLILNHLKTLASIAEEYSKEDVGFELSSAEPEIELTVRNPKSPLLFKKVILTSHYTNESTVWLPIAFKTQIKITCKGFANSAFTSQSLSLISYVTPYHVYPVFDINLVFPSNSDFIQFNPKLDKILIYKIELITEEPNVKLNFVCEKNTLVSDFNP